MGNCFVNNQPSSSDQYQLFCVETTRLMLVFHSLLNIIVADTVSLCLSPQVNENIVELQLLLDEIRLFQQRIDELESILLGSRE